MHTPVTKTELSLVQFNMRPDCSMDAVHPADLHNAEPDDEGVMIVYIKCTKDEITSMTDEELCDSVGLESEEMLWTNRENFL